MQASETYVETHQRLWQRVLQGKNYQQENRTILSKDECESLARYEEACRRFRALKKARGRRYAGCTFESYREENDKQKTAVDKLRDHAADPESLGSRNVVLFGPKGTGKDHLLMALAREAFTKHGMTTIWIQGLDLHSKLRQELFNNTLSELFGTESERTAPLLWISDLLPPTGALTESQQSQLLGFIDHRYNDILPTWVSMNVSGGEEAESRIGAQVVDRLRHDALVLHCNWPSYREPQK